VKELEIDTCQSGDNMKIPLMKVKASRSDSQECENNTCESENAQKMTNEKTHQNIITNATK